MIIIVVVSVVVAKKRQRAAVAKREQIEEELAANPWKLLSTSHASFNLFGPFLTDNAVVFRKGRSITSNNQSAFRFGSRFGATLGKEGRLLRSSPRAKFQGTPCNAFALLL